MSIWAKLLLLVALVVALIGVMWDLQHRGLVQGRAEVQAKWNQEKRELAEAEKAALLSRIKNNERIAEQQALDNEKIKKGHKDEIAAISAANAHRTGLRVPASICGGSAAAAQTSSAPGSDATATGTIALPPAIDRDLQDLMEEADQVVASCRSTQQFVILNGFK